MGMDAIGERGERRGWGKREATAKVSRLVFWDGPIRGCIGEYRRAVWCIAPPIRAFVMSRALGGIANRGF